MGIDTQLRLGCFVHGWRPAASPTSEGVESELAVLGAALLLAGLFARAGRRIGLPTIPFFIVAGITFGPNTPGIVVLEDPESIHLLALLGLVLLLFHLGIEFSIDDLIGGGRRLLLAGGSYIVLNFGAASCSAGRSGGARARCS